MYDTSEFKKGLRVEIEQVPYTMLEVEFVKPGKGQAFTRVKLKNMLTGLTLDRTYKSGEKLNPADIVDVEMQFLYATDDIYHFMNNQNYEQFEIPKNKLDEAWRFLIDNMPVTITLYNGLPVGVNLPNFSILTIVECSPAVKGDTVTNASKLATLQTGATLQVPLFVEQGDKIKVDTRTGAYVERAKS